MIDEFSQSKDEGLLAFYENVRGQVEIDKRSGGRYRFAGDGVNNMPTNSAKKWNGGGCGSPD